MGTQNHYLYQQPKVSDLYSAKVTEENQGAGNNKGGCRYRQYGAFATPRLPDEAKIDMESWLIRAITLTSDNLP